MTPTDILRKHWGYSQFRELQEDIIQSVLDGNDTLALLPTGGGKSICYQVPALLKDGICIVISPLIALMKDQVQHLREKGISAVAIYSGMSAREVDLALDNCVFGHYKLLYVSPERLTTEMMQVRAQKMKVNLLAVDEAHCISQWGYDFRPPYLRIAEFRKLLPGVPVMALTATATPEVVNDLCDKLAFSAHKIFRKSFLRKNLSYSILYEEDKQQRLTRMLEKVNGTALVYVRNRRRTKEVAEFLQRHRISADYYHAGLDHATRSQRQTNCMEGKTRVMVCTNAFGMGIDKPDVRLVIHWDVPDTMEEYFQEAGRAGRDEKKSFAVLLYNQSDVIDLDDRIRHAIPSIDQLRATYQALGNFFQLAVGSGDGVSFDFDLARFCKTYHLNPLSTHEAIRLLQQEGYLTTTDSVFMPSRLMMAVEKEALYRFEVENKKYEPMIRTLLRAYSGIFEEFVRIDENEIARHLKIDRRAAESQLRELQRFNLLQYEPRKEAPQIVYTRPRTDSETMSFNFALLRRRKEAHEQRLTKMKEYLTAPAWCRSQVLLSYFGETASPRCGICDRCLRRNKIEVNDVEFEKIRKTVTEILMQTPLSIQELVSRTKLTNDLHTLQIIEFLIDHRELQYNERNQLILQK